ncbi:MAG: hypothetical protein IJT63_03625 [Lachnospiraceae bacterium]|nr:hypothetical protein [Clostridia bacterium]MBQ7724680.1 hypothetical protein [Lachnospiraceae bacterium]
MDKKITIDRTLYDIYPHITLGVLHFHAEVMPSEESFWDHMKKDVIPQVLGEIEGKNWADIKGIKGSRACYKAFGKDPGKHRVSSEALIRRIRRGDELYHINNVVDVNNLISIKSGLSLGSYDLDKLKGDIILRRALPGEGYQGIGKELLNMENFLVLCDEEGMFGSSHSDSVRAMVTEETKDVLTVIYCFDDETDLEDLLIKSRDVFINFASAKVIEICSVDRETNGTLKGE